MKEPSYCDMRGFLSFLVLRMISKKDISGEEIRKEVEKRKGCKPSPGTIYPVLKELKKEGLIQEVKNSGKTKKYKLTDRGKKELESATKRFVSIFYDMKEDFNVYCCR